MSRGSEDGQCAWPETQNIRLPNEDSVTVARLDG